MQDRVRHQFSRRPEDHRPEVCGFSFSHILLMAHLRSRSAVPATNSTHECIFACSK